MGENFRFGRGAQGHPRVPGCLRGVRDPRRAARGGGGRDGFVEPHPRAGGGGRGRKGGRVPRRSVPARGGGGGGRPAWAATSACRPPTSSRTTAWSAPGHGDLRRLGARPPRRGERGRAADLRDRAAACCVEAYLIDFEGDLYGQTLRIAFVERMRGEKRFDSVATLWSTQMTSATLEQARRGPRLAASTRLGRVRADRCVPSPADDAHRRGQAGDRPEVSGAATTTPAPPRSRSPCSRPGSTSSPSTCASTRRITTRAAGC